jgi:hypothetical protein
VGRGGKGEKWGGNGGQGSGAWGSVAVLKRERGVGAGEGGVIEGRWGV